MQSGLFKIITPRHWTFALAWLRFDQMAAADMVDLISCLGSKESRMFDSGMMVEKTNVISKPLKTSAFHVFLSVR